MSALTPTPALIPSLSPFSGLSLMIHVIIIAVSSFLLPLFGFGKRPEEDSVANTLAIAPSRRTRILKRILSLIIIAALLFALVFSFFMALRSSIIIGIREAVHPEVLAGMLAESHPHEPLLLISESHQSEKQIAEATIEQETPPRTFKTAPYYNFYKLTFKHI